MQTKLLFTLLLFSLASFGQPKKVAAHVKNPSNGLLTGLVSHWGLDQSSGHFTDSKGTNNSTTEANITYSEAGKIANSVTIGASGHIEIGDPTNLRLTNTGSISAWIYPTSLPSCCPTIVSKGDLGLDLNGYTLFVGSSNPRFELADATSNDFLTFSETLSTNTWYNIVVTWDGSTISGYVNAGTPTTLTQTKSAASTGVDFGLGRSYNGGSCCGWNFQGKIEEVDVWNVALTARQVYLLFNHGNGLPFSLYN